MVFEKHRLFVLKLYVLHMNKPRFLKLYLYLRQKNLDHTYRMSFFNPNN